MGYPGDWDGEQTREWSRLVAVGWANAAAISVPTTATQGPTTKTATDGDTGPRPGESTEEFFARKDGEARAEFAEAVKQWRQERAGGGGHATVVEARGGFAREDGGEMESGARSAAVSVNL